MIQLDQVTMRYGAVTALDRASFHLKRGEIVGLLGPNGAGKTTTMRIITTYLTPVAGTVQVGGTDALSHPLAVRERVGYLPEVAPLYPDMQVCSYLQFVARARKVTDPARVDWVVEACGLEGVYLKHIRELSRGYRQRVGLAQALVHDPDVLILDEPTAGLDPHQVRVIRDLVRSLAGRKTILLSTHVLGEAESLVDRAIVIHRGRIVADGKLEDLEQQARTVERVRVRLDGEAPEVKEALSSMGGVRAVVDTPGDRGPTLIVEAATGANVQNAVGQLAQERGWCVRELSEQRYTLEETFMALTRGREERS